MSLLALVLVLAQAPDPASLNGPVFSSPARNRRAFKQQEIINFGALAGGPSPAKPTFTGDASLAYLFTVQSDCTAKCVVDDQGTTCPGLVWGGGSGATCRQIFTGDYALTDITPGNCWHFSGATRTPSNLFTGDFAASVFAYPTNKESTVPYVFQVYDTNNGFFIRNESGVFKAQFDESGAFPLANSAQTSTNGFVLITAHRSGTHHNANVNGSAENSDVVASNAMTAAGTLSGGIGCDDTRLGNALGMGGQWVWAAIYNANKTNVQAGAIATKAVGFPQTTGLSYFGTNTTLCLDPTDGGQADCLSIGLPLIQADKGFRAFSGERTTSKWAADPLDVSSWTASNVTVTTNVMRGPLYENQHAAEMDRIVDSSASFGYVESTGNSALRAPMNYTACVYLATGDAGATVTKARIGLVATNARLDDGGTEVDCDVSALTGTPTLYSCSARMRDMDGGVTLKGRVYAGNGAADQGSVTVGHARLNPGVTCEPMTLSNTAVGNGYLNADTSTWHSDAVGGAHEIVWTPLQTGCDTSSTNSTFGDWAEQPDTIYLHDAYDNSSNHLITYLYGYNSSGHALFRFASEPGVEQLTDLTADNVCFVPNTMYASRAQWTGPTGGTCALAAKWNTCNSSVASCIATSTQISGSGACPDHPPNLNVPQRYDGTVPTSAWILSVRHLTP